MSGTTPAGVRIADMPDLGPFTSSSSVVGEHAGSGRFSATALHNAIGNAMNAKYFGCACDGVTDDTAALQSAVNATAGDALYFSGNIRITGPISTPGGIRIVGAGKTLAVVTLGTNGQVGFNVTGVAPVIFEGFEITPASGVTGTTGIKVAPASGANSESIFRDLQLLNVATGIDTEAAYQWTMENVDILGFTTAGVIVRNTSNPDAGDSAISDCYFQCANSTAAGVQQDSSGGLKISNSKFLSGRYGYALVLDAGASTGDLLISNCSFEGQAGASVSLGQAGAGGNFHSAEITGCQFNNTTQAVSVLNSFATPGWITDLSISGGSMWISASGTAISLDGVTGFSIEGVDIHSLGAGVTCVIVSNHSANGYIAPLNYFGAGITGYVSNAGNAVVVQPRMQCGIGSAPTTTAYGSALFQGPAGTVNFNPAFFAAPQVTCTPSALAGAVSVVATSIAASSFVPVVIANANGVTVPFSWVAMGN